MMKRLTYLLLCLCVVVNSLQAQLNDISSTDITIQPGPADGKPASCKFYVFRPEDELAIYYFGLVCDDYYGMFAKLYSGNAYEIHCGEVGKRTFYVQTATSGKQSVELDLKSDSVYYLKFTTYGPKENPGVYLQKLSPSEGKSMLESFAGKLNIRYSNIPYQNSFYVSDQFREAENISLKMQDSVYRNISKTQHISFVNPQHLDAGMFVMGEGSLFYLSRTISLTFSEALVVRIGGKLKVSSKEEFNEEIDNSLIKKITKPKSDRYRNYKYEILAENDHPSGNYNMLIYLRYEDHEAANLGENNYLVLQDLYRIVSYKNSKGKLEWAMVVYSERGTESELHSKEDLMKRFNEVDQSIQIHTTKTK